MGKKLQSIVAALAAGVLLALPATALAQRGGPGGGGPMGQLSTPSVTSEELNKYADMLALDDAQREAAAMLHEGFLAEYQKLATETRTLIEGAREEAQRSQDWSVMGELQGVIQEARDKQEKMTESFLEDYRLLLTPDQEARWPKVDRLRRRERTLGGVVGNFTIYSGESVDLIAVVQDSDDLTPEAKALAAPVLDEYEVELDRALVERNAYFEESYAEGMRLMRDGDMAKLEEMFDKGKKLSGRLRDINDRYAARIGALLPDAERSAFTSGVRERQYPRVFRDTYLTRVLESTATIDSLTSEQQEQVNAITSRYQAESARLNDQWIKAIQENEENVTVESLMPWRRGGRDGDDPERDAARARRELDDNVLDEVRAILTDEQKALLPEPPARERFQEFRERGGERGDRDRGRREGGGRA